MIMLSQALEGSLLLRPWVRVAQTSHRTIASWFRQSSLFRPFSNFTTRDPETALKPPSTLQRVFTGLLLVGIALLFTVQSFAGTGLIGAGVAALFLAVLVGGLVFRPPFLRHFTSVDLIVICFLCSSLLSTAFSSYVHTSIIGFAKLVTFMSGYLVFRALSEQGQKPITALMWVLVLLGLGESMIGLYQWKMHIQPLATWSDPTVNPELQMIRVWGTLQPSNPNLLAGFLIPCFASSVGLAFRYLQKQTWLLSLILLGISGAILLTLVMTGSRGGFLAIGLMLITVFAYLGHLIWNEVRLSRYGWMKPLWILILIVGLLGAAGGVMSSEKIRTRVTSIFAMRDDSSISFRFNVYNSAIHMVQDNPIVGIGPGNGTFKLVYGLYMVPGYTALGSYSVPLEIAVEQGFIGLFIFLSLILVLKLRTLFALDNPDISLERKLLIGSLFTGVVGSFVYGFFDTIWYRPSVNLLFWFMVAALAALTELPARRDARLSSSDAEA